ncbi:extracellular solute-binding protein [Paenibacillus sp. NAIST15-1]|nr:extracellular solute-binding protein [Paenibacillus sp. NAIST15-1]
MNPHFRNPSAAQPERDRPSLVTIRSIIKAAAVGVSIYSKELVFGTILTPIARMKTIAV